VSLAHDHEPVDQATEVPGDEGFIAARYRAPYRGPYPDEAFDVAEHIVSNSLLRVASRPRMLSKYRYLILLAALVAVTGAAVALLSLVTSDAPSSPAAIGVTAACLSATATGLLLGSRVEARQRADRARLISTLARSDRRHSELHP
jgi:hypothetical protein